MSPAAARPRAGGAARRAEVLAAAIRLFDAKGYYNTTIDDVGAALGVTGPALYRYFRSKSDILVAAFDSTMEYLLEQVAASGDESAARDVDELVDLHLAYALSHRDVMHIVRREAHHLPPADHKRFRSRQQAYLEAWAAALRRDRPQLTQDQALVVVAGVVNLMNQYARRRNELEGAELTSIVSALARAALRAELPAPPSASPRS